MVRLGRVWGAVIVVVAVAAAGSTVAAREGGSTPGRSSTADGSHAVSAATGSGSMSSHPMIPAPPLTIRGSTSPSSTGVRIPPWSTPAVTTPAKAPSTGSGPTAPAPGATSSGASSSTTTATGSTSTGDGSTNTASKAEPATEVAADCDGPAPSQDVLSEEPASIVIACADGGLGLEQLDWTSWGATRATGTGTLWQNLCTPDCADGTFAYYPASVTLSRVVDSTSGPAFSLVSLTYPASAPKKVTGQVLSQFTLWYPGL